MSGRRVRNKDLAEALEITENSIYRLRKSDEMPRLTPQRLAGICEALNCQPGELLEWIPESTASPRAVVNNLAIRRSSDSAATSQPVLVQHAVSNDYPALPRQALTRLTQFCQEILALSWQGNRLYGPGAVVFSDLKEGPQIAYVEKDKLVDPDCLFVIEQNRPELNAVVLYYSGDGYDTDDYELLTLTGPQSPPECFVSLYQGKST
ncbi:hypothetical protein C7271_02055 [filamentous cyanobacterium CCP5]|nr:hypothetical protein C7293_31180 [filamentous cyanobacterium CCT1]PSN20479.1 hypothetical protein C7271_02055 [filamentous cyanobacterium CCP5]